MRTLQRSPACPHQVCVFGGVGGGRRGYTRHVCRRVCGTLSHAPTYLLITKCAPCACCWAAGRARDASAVRDVGLQTQLQKVHVLFI